MQINVDVTNMLKYIRPVSDAIKLISLFIFNGKETYKNNVLTKCQNLQ